MLKKIALILMLIAPMSVFAQKFGHIKTQEIITVMPEYTKAQTDIETMRKQFEDELNALTLGLDREFNVKEILPGTEKYVRKKIRGK